TPYAGSKFAGVDAGRAPTSRKNLARADMDRSRMSDASDRFSVASPQILASIQAGCSIEDAARSVGVPVTTVRRWLRDGRKGTERSTYGGEVATLARLLGFEPMAHQRLFWDIALEHEDGVLAYREVGWTIARQCGKTVALLCLLLWRCMRWPGQVVRYGAQTGMDARAMLADTWWPRLEHSPLAEVLSFRRQSGHEALVFENTSRLGLLASTDKSAHGSTLDAACLDESWAHADHRLEQSCRPAMVTRESAQLYVVSTAGTARRRRSRRAISTWRNPTARTASGPACAGCRPMRCSAGVDATGSSRSPSRSMSSRRCQGLVMSSSTADTCLRSSVPAKP